MLILRSPHSWARKAVFCLGSCHSFCRACALLPSHGHLSASFVLFLFPSPALCILLNNYYWPWDLPPPPALCLWRLNFRGCINQAFWAPGCQLGFSQQEPRWEVSVGGKTGSGCFLPCFPPCWVTAGCPCPLTKSYTIFSEFWLCPLLLPLFGWGVLMGPHSW